MPKIAFEPNAATTETSGSKTPSANSPHGEPTSRLKLQADEIAESSMLDIGMFGFHCTTYFDVNDGIAADLTESFQISSDSNNAAENIELMYDPILKCYYDPATNKYYELQNET